MHHPILDVAEVMMQRQRPTVSDGFLGRRQFLSGVAASVVPLLAGPHLSRGNAAEPTVAAQKAVVSPGLIIREREPLNLEFPFAALKDRITPNDRFFVRSHFAIPKVDARSWRLNVDGFVERALELSYDELRTLPTKTVTATLECAGNSRAMLVPKAHGLLWQLGAVGNAKWTGVPLASVLEKAGVREGAVEVILEGADKGAVNAEPKSPGVVSFARSLPLEKAQRPGVLLAFQMNGKDLPVEHGFPLRVVVPGWYGMASVKWLSRITVSDKPFDGFWQTFHYSYWDRSSGRPMLKPVTELQVKAEIARPAYHEHVAAGKPYRVFGAAWAGDTEVAKVDVSTDGGKSWQPAKLLDDAVPFTWRFWEFEWQVPKQAGRHALMAKATDKHGHTQPAKHDPDRRAYMINFTAPVEVIVG
jgi:DMSO/TMAO reductase YedYZ molybdopterin-dependent catalytic subunit